QGTRARIRRHVIMYIVNPHADLFHMMVVTPIPLLPSGQHRNGICVRNIIDRDLFRFYSSWTRLTETCPKKTWSCDRQNWKWRLQHVHVIACHTRYEFSKHVTSAVIVILEDCGCIPTYETRAGAAVLSLLVLSFCFLL